MGSQKSGDALAVAAIHLLTEGKPGDRETISLRVRLYRSLIAIFLGPVGAHLETLRDQEKDPSPDDLKPLEKLGLELRLAFLLSALEGFSHHEIGQTLNIDESEVEKLLAAAHSDVSRQSKTNVLIIEDEVFISRDLARIVTGLGHDVIGRVRTHRAAVDAVRARRPGLILADVQLADGSNGIDAVHQILEAGELPVIFITAYPDRLLTGLRPEPTFLISKPFSVDEVRAAISQVLYFRNSVRRLDGVKSSHGASIIPLNAPSHLMPTANAVAF